MKLSCPKIKSKSKLQMAHLTKIREILSNNGQENSALYLTFFFGLSNARCISLVDLLLCTDIVSQIHGLDQSEQNFVDTECIHYKEHILAKCINMLSRSLVRLCLVS